METARHPFPVSSTARHYRRIKSESQAYPAICLCLCLRLHYAPISQSSSRGNPGMPAKKKLALYQPPDSEYVTPHAPGLVKVGHATYLSIEGQGAPRSEEFQANIGALYNVTYTIKMAKKFAGQDYTVCKLEGLWWADGGE